MGKLDEYIEDFITAVEMCSFCNRIESRINRKWLAGHIRKEHRLEIRKELEDR